MGEFLAEPACTAGDQELQTLRACLKLAKVSDPCQKWMTDKVAGLGLEAIEDLVHYVKASKYEDNVRDPHKKDELRTTDGVVQSSQCLVLSLRCSA